MTLDLLTPAPWHVGQPCESLCRCWPFRGEKVCSNLHTTEGVDITSPCSGLYPEDAAFIALARNAFQVMLDRGCYAVPFGKPSDAEPMYWKVRTNMGHDCPPEIYQARGGDDKFPDPVSALAWVYDWWHKRANVEARR